MNPRPGVRLGREGPPITLRAADVQAPATGTWRELTQRSLAWLLVAMLGAVLYGSLFGSAKAAAKNRRRPIWIHGGGPLH